MAHQRVALVTGSNKGIGFAIVRALCKQLDGGIVYMTARNEQRGKEALDKLNQEGLQPKFHQLDVTNHDSVRNLKDFIKKTHGGLDILVNNAGIAFKVNAPEPFAVQASVTMETNFTALLDVSRTLIPLLRSHGRVVNVASTSGKWVFPKMSPDLQSRFQATKTEQDVEQLMKEFVEAVKAGDHVTKGWPGDSAYGITKMGVIALTRVQAADLAKDETKEDVLAICCCPGYVDTDMTTHKGPLTVDEGAVTPVYLALLPPGSQNLNGKMLSKKQLVEFW